MNRFWQSSLAGMGALLALSGLAQAQTVLTASSYLPTNNMVTKDILMGWAAEVERATEGRVKIELLPKPVAGAVGTLDAIRDGLADVSWSVDALTPNRFILSRMAELPDLGTSAEVASVAYQRTLEKFFLQANEHEGVQLLGVFNNGPGALFTTKKEVRTVADMSGLKIRAAGGVMSDVMGALGATPVIKPASEAFELLNAGIVDGIAFPVGQIIGLNLQDTLSHGLLVRTGLYNAGYSLFMNQAAFDKLPEEDQKAILSVSGEHFSRLAGKAFDADDKAGLEKLQAAGKMTIATASDAFLEEVKARTASLEEGWIKQAATRNVDGAAALAYYREQVKELTSR